jgi:hypothetical protein
MNEFRREMHDIYKDVSKLLVKKAEMLYEIGIFRDGQRSSINEIYARLKINIVAYLMKECQDWEDEHYTEQ